jgi:hypothetical protein
VYSFVQLGPSPFCQENNFHAKYIWANIDVSLGGVLDKTRSGLDPLRVMRGMPNHPLPTQKYKYWRQIQNQNFEDED